VTVDEEAMIALLQATYDSAQAVAKQQELSVQRAEQELAVLRIERDLLLRRVAALDAAHSELQHTRAQLSDALRRAVRAEMDAEAARHRLIFRSGKTLLGLVRAVIRRGGTSRPELQTVLGGSLLRERGNGVVLVDIVGWPEDDLEDALDRLAARRDAEGTVMILLTDCERFDLFRARGFVFEYLTGGGTTRAERLAELSVAYRVDKVLIAEDDEGIADRVVA
jgi:multidrug efflux pump subunit AcrA (membrane-fusion protein)